MNDVLRLAGITKSYNHGKPNAVDVLQGVDLTVQPGEVVALVAPSGAGKSTMFNLLTGTLKLSAGRIDFLGRDVTRLSQREIALMESRRG